MPQVIQALFDSLAPEDYKGGVLVLGGDGRYFNREAAQVCTFSSTVFSLLLIRVLEDDHPAF